jgi:hypothetical protein
MFGTVLPAGRKFGRITRKVLEENSERRDNAAKWWPDFFQNGPYFEILFKDLIFLMMAIQKLTSPRF